MSFQAVPLRRAAIYTCSSTVRWLRMTSRCGQKAMVEVRSPCSLGLDAFYGDRKQRLASHSCKQETETYVISVET